MVRCLSVVAIIGSLFCCSVWLAAAIQFFQSSLGNCRTFRNETPSASSTLDVYYAMTHVLTLPVFILLSLCFTFVFFLLFYFQLLQHDRLAHEVLLEDLAETAASGPSPHPCTSCTSFTHTLLLLFNSVVTALLALLCVLGVGSIQSANLPDQPSECRQNWQLGLLPLFLDFFCCLQYFVLTLWRGITRCIGDEGDTIDATSSNSGPLTRGAPKGSGQKGGGDDKKGRGKANGNVKYSAVDADDDELFDAEALEGESGGGGPGGSEGRVLAALSGSTEEEVEMMDMLDATPKKKAEGSEGKASAGGAKVPSLLPPPSVEPKAEGKKEEGKAGEGEDGDDEYDYGDIEEEEDEQHVEPL